MLAELERKEQEAADRLQQISSTDELTTWYREYLGQKGSIQLMTRQIGSLDPQERPAFGKRINEVKQALQSRYDAHKNDVKLAEIEAAIAADSLDVTLPGRRPTMGGLHIITRTLREIYNIWGDMGFQIYRSRDVETDELNFELLNIPQHHPARDMWDTFHTTTPGTILRTHTSPGQIHAMREYCPEPIRVILPGMVYRYEQVTARSEMQFHQIEGLAVGKNITFTNLKGTLTAFAHRMFGERPVRFRANYFPFTEPSAEMDVYWGLKNEDDYRITKGTGWLEILGSGMVHPTVLKNGGYDPETYSGFAFGMGVERMAMLRYNINDIRYFWGNDLRFLSQF